MSRVSLEVPDSERPAGGPNFPRCLTKPMPASAATGLLWGLRSMQHKWNMAES